jgi:hypothetical protein
LSPVGELASTVVSASAAYFGITVAPHEYFDQTTEWQVFADNKPVYEVLARRVGQSGHSG